MPEADPFAAHLQAVSRSFAACIGALEAPLRDWVGLSYLLCRVLDTVEDAPWPDAAAQAASFAEALQLCAAPAEPATIRAWAARLPRAVPAGEAALLGDAPRLFAALHALAPGVRRPLQATLRRMGHGMADFARQRTAAGEVRLRDLGEVNRYCYVVAGVVGELLCALLAQAREPAAAAALTARDAVHFGLFLQKVNLLKDQRQDEQEGRFWLPDVAAVRGSLAAHARGAGRYLLAIPRQEAGFRLFCAFSLLLGAHSLHLYDGQQAAPKLARSQTQALFAELQALVRDDAALAEAIDAAVALLPGAAHNAEPGATTDAPAARPGALSPAAYAAWTQALGGDALAYADAQAVGMA